MVGVPAMTLRCSSKCPVIGVR